LWLNLFGLDEVVKMSDKSVDFSLDIARSGKTAIIRCHGKLIAGVDNVLYRDVKPLLPECERVVLDLTDLTRMDSMGLGALVRLYVSVRLGADALQGPEPRRSDFRHVLRVAVWSSPI
jgi:anti-anti-sigma factor